MEKSPDCSNASVAREARKGHRRRISFGQRIQNAVKKTPLAPSQSMSLPRTIIRTPSTAPPITDDLSMENKYNLVVTRELGDYELVKPIGQGSSAVVHLAKFKPLNKSVALKIIDLDRFERNQIDELRRELQIMTLSRHENLLPVYGSFVNGHKLYIVTPFLSAGSCLDIMKCCYPEGFEEVALATILKQCLKGLDYLHKNSHIHRDVKAGNLLMDEDGSVLLADFGVSSSLSEGGDRKSRRRTFVGTPCWMAPEVLSPEKGYDYKADIWSFGITCLELANGQAPYAKYPPMKVLMLTLQHDPPKLDRTRTKHKYSRQFQQMIEMCLIKDPTKRASTDKILEHAFFKQAKQKQYLRKSILDKLPSLEERAIRRRSIPSREPEKGISWDFSSIEDQVISQKENLPPSEVSAHRKSGMKSKSMDANITRGRFLVEISEEKSKHGVKDSRFEVVEKNKKRTSTVRFANVSSSSDESGISQSEDDCGCLNDEPVNLANDSPRSPNLFSVTQLTGETRNLTMKQKTEKKPSP